MSGGSGFVRVVALPAVCAGILVNAATGCGDGASSGVGGSDGTSGPESAEAVGGGGSAAEGGGGGGGGGDQPTRLADVVIQRGRLPLEGGDQLVSTALFAVFAGTPHEPIPPEVLGCTVSEIGRCHVSTCDRAAAPPPREPQPLVDAGRLEVDGLEVPVAAEFGSAPGGAYEFVVPGSWGEDGPFASGAPLAFRGAGAVVPAFQASLDAPARLTVTAPLLGDGLVIDRAAPLEVQWTAGDGSGQVLVSLDDHAHDADAPDDGADDVSLYCQVDVSHGRLEVPAEALARLPAGGASLLVGSSTWSSVVAGDWEVRLAVLDWMLVESAELR